jgi:ribose transport system substrate-binding protein
VPTAATAIWKAAFLANPDAKAVAWDTDALMGLGLSTALQQAHYGSNVLRVGSEGIPSNIELIRNGQQTSATYLPYTWYMYGAADTLNRIFAGESPASLPSEGGGTIFVDKGHNLPPQGQPVHVPVDYNAAYLKVWK